MRRRAATEDSENARAALSAHGIRVRDFQTEVDAVKYAGKTDQEIKDGINAGIAAFNLESEAEIENIDRVAGEIGKKAVGAIRLNPDVDPGAKTHAKTTTGKKGCLLAASGSLDAQAVTTPKGGGSARTARRFGPASSLTHCMTKMGSLPVS